MAWEARSGLKPNYQHTDDNGHFCRNGLGSPFGIETIQPLLPWVNQSPSEWPGKPVRDSSENVREGGKGETRHNKEPNRRPVGIRKQSLLGQPPSHSPPVVRFVPQA